jgi:CHAD domain-containing protein
MTKKAKKQNLKSADSPLSLPSTLGDYAYQVIQEQYQRIIKQEKQVLADNNPESLHQMRVGTRRLRTALQIFDDAVVKLPKIAGAKRLRNLARVLGAVRDADVQLASFADYYRPNLNKQEQKQIDKLAKVLKRKRSKAFAKMNDALTQSQYHWLKDAYTSWLEHPDYRAIAQFPIQTSLPDLINPLLSELLLHPGWLISAEQASGNNGPILHELRKLCKHVRYQAEFFIPFYGEDFQHWVDEIKELQDQLGEFQDTQVLLELLDNELGTQAPIPNLRKAIEQKQREALANWDEIRQTYLDDGFRYHLHQMVLQPSGVVVRIHPELVEHETATLN